MQFANIQWQESVNVKDRPYSLDFNDVYFNSENGLQETEYVFIAHNQLKQRFSALTNDTFCIAETGFGTGLNFLTVAAHWLALAPKTATLRFISIEKHPLHPADFFYAFNLWPHLPEVSNELITQYDNLKTGLNCFKLSNNIELHLHIGDVVDVLPNLKVFDEIWVNAWLLDGFAPAKNPDMWLYETLNHIARISTGGTTFATFTSASAVRKNLEKVGFRVEKYPGFGKKREMLAGYFGGH